MCLEQVVLWVRILPEAALVFIKADLQMYMYMYDGELCCWMSRPSFRNCVQGGLNNKCKKFGGANSFILILCLHVIVP